MRGGVDAVLVQGMGVELQEVTEEECMLAVGAVLHEVADAELVMVVGVYVQEVLVSVGVVMEVGVELQEVHVVVEEDLVEMKVMDAQLQAPVNKVEG